MGQMSQCLLVPACHPISSSFLLWVGAREDGAADCLWGLSFLLPKCPENVEKNGHISQNEYLRNIQDSQGQGKGCTCSVGGSVVWIKEALQILTCICSALF